MLLEAILSILYITFINTGW